MSFNTMEHALRLEPGYGWTWEMLRRWAWQLGQPETAAAFARDLTRRRGGEARSWMMLAEVLARPEQREERLAALERALERNPRLTDAYNLKAEALAEAGRFDEALAACRPSAFGEAVPLYLRGRAAWVEAQRGHADAAIAQTRALVGEDPTYLWAWSNLADWYRAGGATEGYLQAADALVRLAPQRAIAFGYRGDARRFVQGPLRGGGRRSAENPPKRSAAPPPAPCTSSSPNRPGPLTTSCEEFQRQLAEVLGGPGTAPNADETGLPARGTKSVGVLRRYGGCLGRTHTVRSVSAATAARRPGTPRRAGACPGPRHGRPPPRHGRGRGCPRRWCSAPSQRRPWEWCGRRWRGACPAAG